MSSDLDTIQATKEINGFKEIAEGLQKDEHIKEHAKNLPRAFCVMVFKQVYLPKSGKFVASYDNYRVLMGKKDSIEATKKILEDRVKGSFKV